MLQFDLRPRTRIQRAIHNNQNSPKVDILENDESYLLSIEVPGISKDDIKIWIEKDLLIVSGEKKNNYADKDTRHFGERRFGKFERSFWIPEDANRENIKAEFENGILNVTVSKAPKAKPQEIKIS